MIYYQRVKSALTRTDLTKLKLDRLLAPKKADMYFKIAKKGIKIK